MTKEKSRFAVSFEDIVAARHRVHAEISPTPLTYSPSFSELAGKEIYIKWDNKHRTGSFKERGAINFIASLSSEERARGVCAASAGNHALALSYYAKKAGIGCTIVMPRSAPLIKVQSTRKCGATVILEGSVFDEAYAYAEKLSKERSFIFVSAFDDSRIIAGQGTLGLELLDQLPDFDSLIVPCGGGGLISGTALAIKEKRPGVHIVGVQSQWAVEARARHGSLTASPIRPSTIADGIAVKTIGKLTAPIIDSKVDQLSVLSEDQIAGAIMKLLELEKTVVEGAGAAGIAGLLSAALPAHFKKVVVVVCGSNIDMNVLARLIMRDQGEKHRVFRINTSVPDRPGSLQYIAGALAQEGANILEVDHDRSFCRIPGNVSISFVLEIRDDEHKAAIMKCLDSMGIENAEVR